ncbi:putative ribonuclease H-like domain-containing protein [Tanacetum coccineum]
MATIHISKVIVRLICSRIVGINNDYEVNAADIRDDVKVSTSTVQETTHMVSSVKLPMLKKGKDVEVPPTTTKDIQARARERKARSALLMALPDVDLPKRVFLSKLSTEDINSKFLRSLPSTWTSVSLIMRNKEGIDDMDIDDLYNTLKAHEGDVKGTTVSSSSSLNMAFVSKQITSSTKEISTANHVHSAIGQSNKAHGSSSYVDEVMYSFFANQSSAPQLDHDDLEQEESYSLIGRNQLVLIKPRCNALTVTRKVTLQENTEERRIRNTRVTTIGTEESYLAAEEELTNYALMAFTSSKSSSSASSDTEKNKVILKEKIGVLEWHVKDKTNLLTYHKTLLDLATKEKEEILKEKEDLKAKLKKFENSSKNLTKLLDSQISPKVKIGLGYGKEETVCDVSEFDVSKTVFDTSTSDKENSQTYDRFKKVEGFHAVPPPLSGNFIPPKADLSFAGLDDSVYTSTAVTKDAPKSNEVSVETPKEVKSSAPLIQDWDTDSDNESIFRPKQVFEKVNFVKEGEYVRPVKHAKSVKIAKSVRPITPVKPIQQTKKPKESCSSPKVDKRDWNGRMAQNLGLGYSFTKKACFVCGSMSHLIRDCTFHEDRMTQRNVVNKNGYLGTGQKEHLQIALKDKGIADSGCSRHMTGTKEYLSD